MSDFDQVIDQTAQMVKMAKRFVETWGVDTAEPEASSEHPLLRAARDEITVLIDEVVSTYPRPSLIIVGQTAGLKIAREIIERHMG